jgi:hypothetical protein
MNIVATGWCRRSVSSCWRWCQSTSLR